MKNQLLKIMLFLFSLGVAIGCSKDDSKEGEGAPVNTNLTLFRNQTGNPAANALQAQYTGELNDYKLNFYGTFNADGAPTDIHTITYQKTNNDTVVNLLFNQVTKRLASAFVSVNNIKSPIVTRYDYPENNPGVVTVSMYNYDWNSQSSELLLTINLEKDTDPLSDGRENMSGLGSDTTWGIAAIATGIGFAEAVAAYLGGYSGVAAMSGVASTLLTGTIAVSISVPVAIGVVALAITSILNDANASTDDGPYPSNTPIVNPADGNDPTTYLPSPACKNTRIRFVASMDGEGSIMLTGVQGGQGPYKYIVDDKFQDSQVFPNGYNNGGHMVGVVDSNGCVGIKIVTLSREMPAPTGWFSGHYTLNGPDFPLHGQSGEIYVYTYNYFEEPGAERYPAYIYYVKSIIPGMPNFYHITGESSTPNVAWAYWTNSNDNDYMTFSLHTFNHQTDMDEYVIEGSPTINMVKKYMGVDNFAYYISMNAIYSTEVPPGLTQENIDQINALKSAGVQGITVTE